MESIKVINEIDILKMFSDKKEIKSSGDRLTHIIVAFIVSLFMFYLCTLLLD